MEPALKQFSEENDITRFTLHGVEVCFANAIRRTIMSEIPIVAIVTDTYEKNQCHISDNTGRLHNEILKQRLSCIPIHTTLLRDSDDGDKALPGNYSLVVDVKNDTDNTIFVTTEDFQLKDNSTNTVLSKEEMDKRFPGLFPKNVMTQSYIDFARLRPKMGSDIRGEQLSLTADFTVANAQMNSSFNVVSKCAYGNTPDSVRGVEIWDKQEAKLRADGENDESVAFHKKNYHLLDAQRQFIPNSFDFVIQTIGIYENKDIVRKACAIMQNKFIDMIELLTSSSIDIVTGETTIENCYDIRLENEDYTMGKVLEYILYTKFYEGSSENDENKLTFCGFKKFHPHDKRSTVRVAFQNKSNTTDVARILKMACVDAQEVFKTIHSLFK